MSGVASPTSALRRRAVLEAAIEQAIAALDQIDGDADLEEPHDAEPEETDWTYGEKTDQRGLGWKLGADR